MKENCGPATAKHFLHLHEPGGGLSRLLCQRDKRQRLLTQEPGHDIRQIRAHRRFGMEAPGECLLSHRFGEDLRIEADPDAPARQLSRQVGHNLAVRPPNEPQ